MISKNHHGLRRVLAIMTPLLKRCNNSEKLLIVGLIIIFGWNYLPRLKYNRVPTLRK